MSTTRVSSPDVQNPAKSVGPFKTLAGVADELLKPLYNVEAKAQGFKATVVKGVILEDASPKINLTLPVGQISETVEVTAEAENTPLLKTQQSDAGFLPALKIIC